jgi:hypothetical protein
VFHRSERTNSQSFCQSPGTALRLVAEAFRSALEQLRRSEDLIHRTSMALCTFVAQSSACNRLHTMRERCARWLLHTHESTSAVASTRGRVTIHDRDGLVPCPWL